MEQNAYQAQYAAFSALTEQRLGELSARYLPAASRIGRRRSTVFWAAASGCVRC